MLLKVFVDSDVVVSSLLSSSGAAAALFGQTECLFYVSTFSLKELAIVCSELGITRERLDRRVKKQCVVVSLADMPKIQTTFGAFVADIHDSHIVAGAKAASVQFLATYNLKHFRIDQIRERFGIITFPPGNFLQYLRGRN